MPRRPAAPRGADPDVAFQAADALHDLLCCRNEAAWRDVPPERVAAALLGAMRRHPGDEDVQCRGCVALYRLCDRFPALRASLQQDRAVLATVQRAATVDPILETRDFYTKELCVWLRPCLGECVTGTGWGVGTPKKSQSSHFFCTGHIGHISIQFFCSHTFFVHIVLFRQAIIFHIFCSQTYTYVNMLLIFFDANLLLFHVDVCHCAVWHLPRTWF